MAPPATGKMVKGLTMCYSVILITFYPAAVSGYWAFGNKVSSNILKSLMPDEGPSLAPIWLLGLAAVFVLLQLLAIGLVSPSRADGGAAVTKPTDWYSSPFRHRSTLKSPMRLWRRSQRTQVEPSSRRGISSRGCS